MVLVVESVVLAKYWADKVPEISRLEQPKFHFCVSFASRRTDGCAKNTRA
jgi:hypothetical protein